MALFAIWMYGWNCLDGKGKEGLASGCSSTATNKNLSLESITAPADHTCRGQRGERRGKTRILCSFKGEGTNSLLDLPQPLSVHDSST